MIALSKMTPTKRALVRFLLLLNRVAHFADVVLLFLVAQYFKSANDNTIMSVVLLALPIIQLIRAVKWELRIMKSKTLIRLTAKNGRVQAFTGKQGAGKTSFMLYSLSVLKPTNIYTNFPAKIRGKYTCVLEKDVLNLDHAIPDGSVTVISEATLLYHNLMTQTRDFKNAHPELFAQQICQQLVRHFFDGNMFYDSVDITRLPQVLKDNIGLTNFMLGQGSIRLSYFTGLIIGLVGRFCGVQIDGSVRFWDVQQLEHIPEQGYTFDLSRQEKDTNDKNFANLIRFCGFNTLDKFEYDDRFMRGVYADLPKHQNAFWSSLDFNNDLLKRIGYGDILDFFEKKKAKNAVAPAVTQK